SSISSRSAAMPSEVIGSVLCSEPDTHPHSQIEAAMWLFRKTRCVDRGFTAHGLWRVRAIHRCPKPMQGKDDI
ncbi:MAG: hypothetical protein ACXWEL_00935, partial [Solirubrobacterales bacterium]